jgi:hypothetical protein
MQIVMHDLLRYHLERDLKSWSFLDMLERRRADELSSPAPVVPAQNAGERGQSG